MNTSAVGPAAEHPPVDQHRVVAVLRHRAEVVGRDQHHPALVAQLRQQPHDRVLGRDVDAGERLVEQDHLALLRQRPGEEHPLPLPARELADLAVRGSRPCRPARAPPRPARGRGPRAGAASPCGRSGPSSPRPRPAPGRSSRPPRPAARRRRGSSAQRRARRAAEDLDAAGGERHEAHDRLEQRRLARAVDPDERGDRAARDGEARVLDRRQPGAVGDADVAEPQPVSPPRAIGRGSPADGSATFMAPAPRRWSRRSPAAGRGRSAPARPARDRLST